MKKIALLLPALLLALMLCLAHGAAADDAPFPWYGFTETAVQQEVPRDSSTRAFPVAAGRAVHVENEGTKTVLFYMEGDPVPVPCYIVPGDAARIRLVPAAADDVAGLVFSDLWGRFASLTDLLDPARGAFVYEQALEGASEGVRHPFNIGILADVRLQDDPDALFYFLVPGEECLPDVEAYLLEAGAPGVRREYAEDTAKTAAPRAYVLHVMDQDGSPVPDMYVNFCTDKACTMLQSGADGTITWAGPMDRYHVQLLMAPEGCSFDPAFEMYVGPAYGEWQLLIRRD